MIGLSKAKPINKDAYKIIRKAKPEDKWDAGYIPPSNAFFSNNSLKTVKPTKSIIKNGVYESVIGKRRGSMVIVGLAKKTNGKNQHGRWICRCDCGNFESRSNPIKWLKIYHPDSCAECQKRDCLMRPRFLQETKK